jgi:PRTRC genetic system protein E
MFFKKLSVLLNGSDMAISVRGDEVQLTVSIVPRSTAPEKKNKDSPVLPIMTVTGSPEEIDQHFFEVITRPINKATTFLVQEAQLHAAAEKKAEEKKSSAKDRQAVAKTTTSPKKVEEPVVEEEKEEVVDSAQCSLF